MCRSELEQRNNICTYILWFHVFLLHRVIVLLHDQCVSSTQTYGGCVWIYAIYLDYLLTAMMKARTTSAFHMKRVDSFHLTLLNWVKQYECAEQPNTFETIKDKSHLLIVLSPVTEKEKINVTLFHQTLGIENYWSTTQNGSTHKLCCLNGIRE